LFGGGGAAGGSSLFGKPAGTASTIGAGGGLFGGGGGGGGGLFGNVNTASGNQPNQSSGGSLFGGGLGQQQQQQTNTTPSLFGNRPSPLGATQPQNQQGLTQFQQQQNAFFNVPESITTQAQGGPTLFGGNLAPSEALLRARQQRHLASQPPASGTTLEPVKELHDVMNAYNPQHPEYRFKAFFYNIAQDPRQKVKIQNIDERTWHELLDKVGGEENENGLWPCRVDGFDGLYQREQAQEEELKSQEAFVNAYNQCIRQINSWKEGSYEVRRTQYERRREEHAHRVLKVMRKLESFRAAYHRRVNPQLSMRRGGGTAYNRGAVNGGSTFASKEERELFEVLQNLKRALDGSGKESLSRQAQQLTTTARVKTQELSRQLATSPLRGGGGSLFAGTTTANNGGYEINHQRTTTSPPSSSGQQQTKNKKKSNKPVLLQPYDRERAEVTKTDLDDLSSHKDVVDHLAGNIKSMREDLTRMCLAYGLQPVISATTTDPLSFQPQQQYQQQFQQQQQNPAALAAHQYGTTTTPTRSTFF
jgi:nuclear pore complex protein Nup54